LADLDKLVMQRGCTRSEMLRALARAEVVRAKVRAGVAAVAALTIVYDHHVRDLSEKLTELQHQMGEGVRSAMHVHLSHDYCLEVIVIRGKSDRLHAVADKILAMRGVKHGGIEIIADADLEHDHVHPHQHSLPPRDTPARRVPSAQRKRPAHRRAGPTHTH
jgi:CopG family nickel-responsive transcriptional regulator